MSIGGAMTDHTKKTMMIVGYVPLSTWGYSPNLNKEEFEKRLREIDPELGRIRGCLWAKDEQGVYPVFLIKNASQIVTHLVRWAENNVQNWFDLCILDKGDRYFIILWPNLEKSKERQIINHMMVNEQIIIENEWSFLFLFCPLIFGSDGRGTFDSLEIGNRANLGFVDIDAVSLDPLKVEMDPILIGSFDVCFEHKTAEKHIDTYFAD